jgi:hypothetical protein
MKMTGRQPLETIPIDKIDTTHGWYLAHSLGQRFVVRDKIEKELNRNGITTFNPFADRPFLYEKGSETERKILLNNKVNQKTNKGIVEGDLQDVFNAGGVIAYVHSPSFGMAFEIFYASYILDDPVYLILGEKAQDLRYHPWLSHLCEGIIELD